MATITTDKVAVTPPTDPEIAAYYKANAAKYGGVEKRVISQAVVPAKALADTIAGRARAGTPFAAAASPAGLSAEDVSVGPQSKTEFTSLAGAQIAAAVFAAQNTSGGAPGYKPPATGNMAALLPQPDRRLSAKMHTN